MLSFFKSVFRWLSGFKEPQAFIPLIAFLFTVWLTYHPANSDKTNFEQARAKVQSVVNNIHNYFSAELPTPVRPSEPDGSSPPVIISEKQGYEVMTSNAPNIGVNMERARTVKIDPLRKNIVHIGLRITSSSKEWKVFARNNNLGTPGWNVGTEDGNKCSVSNELNGLHNYYVEKRPDEIADLQIIRPGAPVSMVIEAVCRDPLNVDDQFQIGAQVYLLAADAPRGSDAIAASFNASAVPAK